MNTHSDFVHAKKFDFIHDTHVQFLASCIPTDCLQTNMSVKLYNYTTECYRICLKIDACV